MEGHFTNYRKKIIFFERKGRVLESLKVTLKHSSLEKIKDQSFMFIENRFQLATL